MNIRKRLSALEQKRRKETRFFIARQDFHDDNLFHLFETGTQSAFDSSDTVMTSDELNQWENQQADNVNLIKLVFEDVLGLNS